MSGDLIATARKLLGGGEQPPSQSDMRRAISTAYYALFHAIAQQAADLLVLGVNGTPAVPAWSQIYRGINHGPAKNACQKVAGNSIFPDALRDCAKAFIELQALRHDADYDPAFRTSVIEAQEAIQLAESAIGKFMRVSSLDRLSFVTHLLFLQR